MVCLIKNEQLADDRKVENEGWQYRMTIDISYMS